MTQESGATAYDTPVPANLTVEQTEKHNRLWVKATDSCRGLIGLGTRWSKPGWFARRKIVRALGLIDRCAQIAGETWQIRWYRGKLRQALGQNQAALDQFLSAATDAPSKFAADMWREASLEALSIGRGDVAVRCSDRAIQCRPNDPGLYSNLALAHVLAGSDSQATEAAARACAIDPRDEVNRNVRQLVSDIASGKRKRPSRMTPFGASDH